MLKIRYRERPDVYVSGDPPIYYEKDNPRRSVAPDVFVVFGAAKHRRNIYKLWEEPKAPDFVPEVASKNTWREDLGRMHDLYAAPSASPVLLRGASPRAPRLRAPAPAQLAVHGR